MFRRSRNLPPGQTLPAQHRLRIFLGYQHVVLVRRLRAEEHPATADDGKNAEEGDVPCSASLLNGGFSKRLLVLQDMEGVINVPDALGMAVCD